MNFEKAYTFDDLLLVPQYSTLESRHDIDTSTRLVREAYMKIPILSSNMDTITEYDMAEAMIKLGGNGVIHRFMTVGEEANIVYKLSKITPFVLAAVGVKEEDKERAYFLANAGVFAFVVDIAHGDSLLCNNMVSFLKKEYPNHSIIAGNVATYEGTKRLIESGADSIKVGIGSGSVCSTRIVTGFGVPQMTAIMDCSRACEEFDKTLIADGGIRSSADVVKALAAGADSVMLGNLLSGTEETPGGKVIVEGIVFKSFRGMASTGAMESKKKISNEYSNFNVTPEGVEVLVKYKGKVKDIIDKLVEGTIRGMSYAGAETIPELQYKAQFIEISLAGKIESGIHDV